MNSDPEWQAHNSAFIHADRAAVDLGMMSLKTGLVVNSGALVALLAFLGGSSNLGCTEMVGIFEKLSSSAYYFVYGVSSAAINTAIAYFYQSGVAGATWIPYKKRRSIQIESEERASELITYVTVVPMVLLAALSLGFFIYGAFSVVSAYSAVDFLGHVDKLLTQRRAATI